MCGWFISNRVRAMLGTHKKVSKLLKNSKYFPSLLTTIITIVLKTTKVIKSAVFNDFVTLAIQPRII